MSATPAQIIRKVLIGASLAVDSTTAAWSIFTSNLPESPDTAVAVYDTVGTPDGRLMTGERIEHPGIQIRLRTASYPDGWNRAKDIAAVLDAIHNFEVTISVTEKWKLQNVSRTAPIIPLGIETEGDRKRHNFSINAIITMSRME